MTDCALAFRAKTVVAKPAAKVKRAEKTMFLADIFIGGSIRGENLKLRQVYKVKLSGAICFAVVSRRRKLRKDGVRSAL